MRAPRPELSVNGRGCRAACRAQIGTARHQVAAGADRLQRLQPADVRHLGQAAGELVLLRGVARHQAQQEVAAAADHVALAHLRPVRHLRLEASQHRLLLAVEPDQGEERDRPAQRLRIGVAMVAADDAELLEPAHAAQAGRRRDAGAAGQLDIGHAAVLLELADDAAVDGVEFRRRGGLVCALHRGGRCIAQGSGREDWARHPGWPPSCLHRGKTRSYPGPTRRNPNPPP